VLFFQRSIFIDLEECPNPECQPSVILQDPASIVLSIIESIHQFVIINYEKEG